MNAAPELPALAAILTAVLLLAGGVMTLIGAAGLLRLPTFYQRVHAPTLGTTLGTGCIALASMIYFSTLGSRVVIHELLIVVFVAMTMPISLIVLVRAAVSRETSRSEGGRAGRDDGSRR